jgi:hypothetical protein
MRNRWSRTRGTSILKQIKDLKMTVSIIPKLIEFYRQFVKADRTARVAKLYDLLRRHYGQNR